MNTLIKSLKDNQGLEILMFHNRDVLRVTARPIKCYGDVLQLLVLQPGQYKNQEIYIPVSNIQLFKIIELPKE